MSISMDPDQARHFVGPDLGPNCLQRYKLLVITPTGLCSVSSWKLKVQIKNFDNQHHWIAAQACLTLHTV